MNITDQEAPSTRPYLIRALHEWCGDNGFSPYIAVHVDASVQVPMEFVKNGEIVLNVSFDATSALRLGNEFIEFKARFGGAAREIVVPVTHVLAIYARENGQGMAFPVPSAPTSAGPSVLPPAEGGARGTPPRLTAVDTQSSNNSESEEPPPSPPGGPKPSLKRVK